MNILDINNVNLTKYMFFTGKGGVGKTSIACSFAVNLADQGQKVLLISTDPASNLQDVFNTKLSSLGKKIDDVPGLTVANLDPIESAANYKDSVVAPYRGKLPESVIRNMEEQLSGSCTVEIAAFNEFAHFLTDSNISNDYDHIVFDTAPTGHTLRLLQLPSAWNDFISNNAHGASCLGQLSGLGDKKEMYANAVSTLADSKLTTLLLITRPDETPLKEAERASKELQSIGINNQLLLVNGLLEKYDDQTSKSLYEKQRKALKAMPAELKNKKTFYVPMRAYNISGIKNIRNMLTDDKYIVSEHKISDQDLPGLKNVINDLFESNKKVIFTMGKGGVGKTTMAAAIALGLAQKGKKVHLATTDPAAHLDYIISETNLITMSRIDEHKQLEIYRKEVLAKAIANKASASDIAYIEEDLRSPCTQEIAVFRAFADIVEKANEKVVVIDTAPTGHTLLLMDSSQSYAKEVERSAGEVTASVRNLLPRLRNKKETAVVIVTLPEETPYHEAKRLEDDLDRAGISVKWWIINASMFKTNSTNLLIRAKSSNEIQWINKINKHTKGNGALIAWTDAEITDSNILEIFQLTS